MNSQTSRNEPLKSMPAGVFKTITKVRPSGSLQARKDSTGHVCFFWRYSIGASSERVQIGPFDPVAPPKSLTPTPKGYSVAAAVRTAEGLALQHHEHREQGGRPALLALDREIARKAAEAAEEAAMERIAAEKYTLRNLLLAYCRYLQDQGRRSHSDARSIFELHVFAPWPGLADQPANSITEEQIADLMRRLHQHGKGRTANKLRSYVRAAYQVARASRTKPSIPEEFKAFSVTVNPASETQPDETQNRADKSALALPDMRAYWQSIEMMEGFKGAVLRLHLLTGGQRIEQLVRLRTADCNSSSISLLDGKGRPGKPPRVIGIPLLPEAKKALEECKPAGLYAISTDEGRTHLASSTLSTWAVRAATGIKDFRTKRIRSGVETLLASAGVDKEHRGRLQSHGISGVQDRHYNDHDYADQKLNALRILYRKLTERE